MVQEDSVEVIREQGEESGAELQNSVVDATGAHIPAHIINRAKKVLKRTRSDLLRRSRRRSLENLGPTIAPVEEEREQKSSSISDKENSAATLSSSAAAINNDLPNAEPYTAFGETLVSTTRNEQSVLLSRSFARTFSMDKLNFTHFFSTESERALLDDDDDDEEGFGHFFTTESPPWSRDFPPSLLDDEQEKDWARFSSMDIKPPSSAPLYTLDEEHHEEDCSHASEISEATTTTSPELERTETSCSTFFSAGPGTPFTRHSEKSEGTGHSKHTLPDYMKIEETAELYELWETCEEWSTEQVKSMVFTTGMPWKRRLSCWPRLLGIDDEPIVFRDDVDQSIIDEIEKDVYRTFPELFSDLHRESLRRILISYAATHRSIGYCQSMNLICGLLLIVGFDDETALKMFTKLIDVYCPDYHSPHLSGIFRDSGVIEVLLAHWFPEIHEKMAYANIPVMWVVSEHLMTLCCREWGLDTVLWLWDVFMACGPSAVISANLAIIDLYFPAEFSLNRRMTDKSLDDILNQKTSSKPTSPEEPPLISLDPAQTTKRKSEENKPSSLLSNLCRRSNRSDRQLTTFKKSKSRVLLRDPAEILYAFRRNARNSLMTREGAQSLIRRIREFQSEINMETVNELRSQF